MLWTKILCTWAIALRIDVRTLHLIPTSYFLLPTLIFSIVGLVGAIAKID